MIIFGGLMKRRHFMKCLGAAAALPAAGCSVVRSGNRFEKPAGTMATTTLGKTGITVPRLGFGSHLKNDLKKKPRERDRMIKQGFEGGINLFDVYDHSGYSQFKPMGESLRSFRKEALISLCVVKQTEKMQAEIDGALDSFHTDYIDLYRLYAVDDDRVAMMDKNRKAGKIRAIGVVSHDEPTMMKYLDDYGSTLDYVMIVYNFHHNNGFFTQKGFTNNTYDALIPRCERMGLGILGIKPMGSDAMVELAQKKGFYDEKEVNPSQAMLRHVFAHPEIDCTMPAMNSMDELYCNLHAAYKPALSSPEKSLLSRLSYTADESKGAYLPPHYAWLENWSRKRHA